MKQTLNSKLSATAIIRFSIVLALLGISACSSTKLVSRWHDTGYSGPKFKNVLVIGIMKNDIRRRYFEDELVKILRNNGGQAVTSYTLIPDLASIDDKTKMTTIVEQIGVDSVVITSLQSIDQQQRTVPAQVDYIPTMGRGYYGYYRSSYHAVYQPAYTTTDTIVRLETRVYAVATKAMIWAGTTESLNPGSADSVIKETADVIRKDMQEHGLIQ